MAIEGEREGTGAVEDSSEDENYFADFNAVMDEDESLEEEQEAASEGESPDLPTSKGTVIPPAPAPEPAAPAPAPEGTPAQAPAQAPAPAVPATSPATPEAPAQAPAPSEAPKAFDMDAYVAEHLPRLEKLYTFSEEEATQLQTEPELVLPKVAARLHLRIVQDALSGISAVLPQIIQRQQEQAEAERSSWDQFYSVNNDIRGKVTQDQILSVAGMFKQINPQATPDQVIREVGRIIRTSLGLQEPSAAPVPPAQVPASPSAPVTQQPFVPARGSAGATPVKQDNPWASMAEELDEF